MCLSTIGVITEIDGSAGKVSLRGILVNVNLSIIDEPTIGDYVLVHAGFAIQKYDTEEALETIAMLKEALRDESF